MNTIIKSSLIGGIGIVVMSLIVGIGIVHISQRISYKIDRYKQLEGQASELCWKYGYDTLDRIEYRDNYYAECSKSWSVARNGYAQLGDFDMCIPYKVGIACRN